MDTIDANTQASSASTLATSPLFIALMALLAVVGLVLAFVAYKVKRKKLDDKRRDHSLDSELANLEARGAYSYGPFTPANQ